jgi:osmotically-inducible protein OsmY
MKKNACRGLLLGATLLPILLQGCLPMVAAGASGGALAPLTAARSARRPTTNRSSGRRVPASAKSPGRTSHANFTSYNRKVLITGEVPSEQVRIEVESIVSAVPQVQGRVQRADGRPGDVVLGTQQRRLHHHPRQEPLRRRRQVQPCPCQGRHRSRRGLPDGNGDQREADAAIQVARTTSEVKKVVTLFEIIADTPARELEASPSVQATPAGSDG